jgi:sRNA-binding regulator protein Hfq
MSSQDTVVPGGNAGATPPYPPSKKKWRELLPPSLSMHTFAEDSKRFQAELCYLQKQMQLQTPMGIVLEDGERIEGCIEWYDRDSLKVRGRSRTLVYKAAIKYMYKLGEGGKAGNRE